MSEQSEPQNTSLDGVSIELCIEDKLHLDSGTGLFDMLESLPKIKLRHNKQVSISKHNVRNNHKIFEIISKNMNLHELDISEITFVDGMYDIEKLQFIRSNCRLPPQLKIFKLFGDYLFSDLYSRRILLNDGLEKLYLIDIESLNWIECLPLSLEKIYVKNKYTEEELDEYTKMLPYGCSINSFT